MLRSRREKLPQPRWSTESASTSTISISKYQSTSMNIDNEKRTMRNQDGMSGLSCVNWYYSACEVWAYLTVSLRRLAVSNSKQCRYYQHCLTEQILAPSCWNYPGFSLVAVVDVPSLALAKANNHRAFVKVAQCSLIPFSKYFNFDIFIPCFRVYRSFV